MNTSRFRFELASPADDADLRRIMAETPMPGRITVSFRREPSWFGAAVVDGSSRQVVACRDTETGRIIGFGCRSLRELYVNGQIETVGYLSSLRVLEEYRNLGLIAPGYAFFHELHADNRVPYYLTTIAEGNETALRVLTSGRAGLPGYHPFGRYHTLAIPLPRRSRRVPAPPAGMTIRPARAEDVSVILHFLRQWGPQRQFFPHYERSDLIMPEGLLRGLELDRLLLAERGGHLVGTLAGWDQHAYRQSVVHDYAGPIRWLRPLYNGWAWLRGRPSLPAIGQPLRYLTAALPAEAEDQEGVFAALLAALREHCAGAATYLMLGLHEKDRLLHIARRYATAYYTTLLFVAAWDDGLGRIEAVDDRAPYLELGSL
jgi:hypothetical protein